MDLVSSTITNPLSYAVKMHSARHGPPARPVPASRGGLAVPVVLGRACRARRRTAAHGSPGCINRLPPRVGAHLDPSVGIEGPEHEAAEHHIHHLSLHVIAGPES